MYLSTYFLQLSIRDRGPQTLLLLSLISATARGQKIVALALKRKSVSFQRPPLSGLS